MRSLLSSLRSRSPPSFFFCHYRRCARRVVRSCGPGRTPFHAIRFRRSGAAGSNLDVAVRTAGDMLDGLCSLHVRGRESVAVHGRAESAAVPARGLQRKSPESQLSASPSSEGTKSEENWAPRHSQPSIVLHSNRAVSTARVCVERTGVRNGLGSVYPEFRAAANARKNNKKNRHGAGLFFPLRPAPCGMAGRGEDGETQRRGLSAGADLDSIGATAACSDGGRDWPPPTTATLATDTLPRKRTTGNARHPATNHTSPPRATQPQHRESGSTHSDSEPSAPS